MFLLIANSKILQAYDSIEAARKGIEFYTEDMGIGDLVIVEIVERYVRKTYYDKAEDKVPSKRS